GLPSLGMRRSPELAVAAYRLALAVTGDEERAVASVEAAARRSDEAGDRFLNVVREEARTRRSGAPDPPTAPRPPPPSQISYADWAVLARVALRGLDVTD